MKIIIEKTINIDGQSVVFTTKEYDDDTEKIMERLKDLVVSPAFRTAFHARSYTPFIFYDEKEKYEYHIQRVSQDKAVVLDCFVNHIAPYGDITAVIINGSKEIVLQKRNDDIDYKKLMDGTVSNELYLGLKEQTCGCIHCLKIFKSSDIVEYINEPNGTKTALCPFCGIDGVLGESISPAPITKEFLQSFWLSDN